MATFTVSPGAISTGNNVRGYVPLTFRLAQLAGFTDYLLTFSRVRVLSCTAHVLADPTASNVFGGGIALCPSYDYVQSQLFTQRLAGGASAAPAVVTAGIYDVKEGPATDADSTLRIAATVDGAKVEIAGGDPKVDVEVGCDLQRFDGASSTTVNSGVGVNTSGRITSTRTFSQWVNSGYGTEYPSARGAVRGLVDDHPTTVTFQVPRQAAASQTTFNLPPAAFTQLEQFKRFRVVFPSTSKRQIRLPCSWYTFMVGDGPVSNTGDLAGFPRYMSSRRWMPLQWFDSTEDRDLTLYGPFVTPVAVPQDLSTPISLSIYLKFRLQFAGQV